MLLISLTKHPTRPVTLVYYLSAEVMIEKSESNQQIECIKLWHLVPFPLDQNDQLMKRFITAIYR